MTITITKTKVALAVLTIALIAPATAWASGVFDDVPDGRFFTEAAEWAAAEGITTGVSTDPPLFAPDENVTRGQNVTFLKRYDDNIVQPGLDGLQMEIDAAEADIATNTADIATNTADIDALETLVAPLTNSVAAFASGDSNVTLTATDEVVQTVSITAPADGIVVVNSSADLDQTGGTALGGRCSITTGTTHDFGHLQISYVEVGQQQTVSGTRGFDVSDGDVFTVNLVCDSFAGTGTVRDAALTAVFAPT